MRTDGDRRCTVSASAGGRMLERRLGDVASSVHLGDAGVPVDLQPSRRVDAIATIPVGGEPIGMTEGFGSVWVVSSEFLSGGKPAVRRIDPATNEVIATIPVGEGSARDDRRLRLDLGVELRERHGHADRPGRRTTVVATIDVCDAPEGFAVGAGSVWVVCENERGGRDRIDPRATGCADTIAVGERAALRDVRVRQRLGVQLRGVDACRGSTPSRNQVTRRSRPISAWQVLTAFDGTIWVSNTDVDTVQRIDPATRRGHRDDRHESSRPTGLSRWTGRCGSRARSDRSSRGSIPRPNEVTDTCFEVAIRARSTRTRSSRWRTATCGSRCSSASEVVRVAVPA